VKRALITGMSGSGKSPLLNELAACGYQAVDTDCGDYFETVLVERLWREDRSGTAPAANVRTGGEAGRRGRRQLGCLRATNTAFIGSPGASCTSTEPNPAAASICRATCSPHAVPSPAPPSASDTVRQCSVLTA
jgi:hypothetical protein